MVITFTWSTKIVPVLSCIEMDNFILSKKKKKNYIWFILKFCFFILWYGDGGNIVANENILINDGGVPVKGSPTLIIKERIIHCFNGGK